MPKCKIEGCQYADGGPDEVFIRDASKKSGWRAVCKDHRREMRSKQRPVTPSATTVSWPSEVSTAPPSSVDDLIRYYNLDPEEWEVITQRISIAPSTHGAPAKASRSVGLQRRRPTPVLNLERVYINPDYPATSGDDRPAVRSKVRTALIVPDGHIDYNMNGHGQLIPYHDRKAWDIVCQVAEAVMPDTIVYLGDMLDCPAWTDKFLHTPNMGHLNVAMRELVWWTQRLRSTLRRGGDFIYLEGNHEVRIGKTIGKYVKQGYDLRQVDAEHPIWHVAHLMNLNAMGITYIDGYPTNGYWLNENLCIKHGSKYGSDSGESMRKILGAARCSEIIGHIHRCERASKTMMRYEGAVTYTACSPGTLANVRGPIPHAGSEKNWQNGFALVEYEEGNGGFQIMLYEIYNGECIFHGQKIIGHDRLAIIRQATGVGHLAGDDGSL